MAKVFVSHNGCEPTEFDAARLIQILLNDLGLEVGTISKPNIAVFLGCTFTQQKENESLEFINSLIADSQHDLVVVSGCYLNTFTHPKVSFARTVDVPRIINDYMRKVGCTFRVSEGKDIETTQYSPTPFVSISDGCYGSCSYCSIKSIRGGHRSRPMSQVMADIEQVASQTSKIKLTSIETAGYGLDIGLTLGDLLRSVFRTFPYLTVELGSLNPRLVSKFTNLDLRSLADEHIVGNLHLPLQSASNRVLRAMRRGYTWEEYEGLKSRLSLMGAKRFSTDLIAGFPGETENDHIATLSFLKDYELDFAQIFFFEPRPGTEASSMPMENRSTRVMRGVELIAQFALSYMRYKDINPVSVIKGDVVLPFNSNLNIRMEDFADECQGSIS